MMWTTLADLYYSPIQLTRRVVPVRGELYVDGIIGLANLLRIVSLVSPFATCVRVVNHHGGLL